MDEPSKFSEEFEEQEILKKYSIKDFPELHPYYDKLYNLSLERLALLNPGTYNKLEKEVKEKGLTEEMKIKLAKIYGQLEKFYIEIFNLDQDALWLIINRNSIQLELINDLLYRRARIPRLLPDYEYKFHLHIPSPKIGLTDMMKKLEVYEKSEFTHVISQLHRMREEAAARILLSFDLSTRISLLEDQINENKRRIEKLFGNPGELLEIYQRYIYPHYDVPRLYVIEATIILVPLGNFIEI
jgi:plasmid maintenance system antidote protein VapI